MYQIKCDDYILYDPRKEELILQNPKCSLKENTVGSASFTILSNHPYYDRLQKMRSVIEIKQDSNVVFRGRLTEDTRDFDNHKEADVEGALAYFNDSVVDPFVFPDDFEGKDDYEAAATTGNVVEYFLKWLIDNHNSQVEAFQQFKLGIVTVADKNNYISFSNSDYAKTWATIESKLFKGSLGGYICIRYEADGNYVDYLSDFDLTNIQRIEYGKNLLDISTNSSATETYSAVLPLGMRHKEIDEASDNEARLTIEELPDGELTDDIVKEGKFLYSKSARQQYGFVCAPTSDTTFEDVSLVGNLQDRGVEWLTSTGIKLKNTIEITAVDLHFSDDEIAAFRIYRYIKVYSKPHDHEGMYKLTSLDIDILNPQNTKITLGDTTQTLTDINSGIRKNLAETVKTVVVQVEGQSVDITEIQNTLTEQSTTMVNTCETIILQAAETFVQTGNYESFVESVQSQLQIMSDQISLNFSQLTDQIENVNGDLQEKFNMVTKYFTFDINGLTIGQVDNPNKVVIDNDTISILVNDVVVQSFDSNGQALIPELNVTRKMNLFGYLIDQDEDGNVNCEYVGGEI